MSYTLKDCVKGRVTFQYFRDDKLWYKCDNGFMFGVPVNDAGGATFLHEDKGMLFMRWIRRELENQ